MEKKKLKLSISGSSKKTINSIEQAKSQSKNTVVIEKKPNKKKDTNIGDRILHSDIPEDLVIT